jgi:hypothetical protein
MIHVYKSTDVDALLTGFLMLDYCLRFAFSENEAMPHRIEIFKFIRLSPKMNKISTKIHITLGLKMQEWSGGRDFLSANGALREHPAEFV